MYPCVNVVPKDNTLQSVLHIVAALVLVENIVVVVAVVVIHKMIVFHDCKELPLPFV